MRRLRTARGSVDPLADRVPRRIAVEQRAGDGRVRDPGAGERAGELGHAARRAVREPLARRHRLVVERPRRLQVEDHDRHLRRLHRGQHLRRRRVGRRVERGPARRGRRQLARPPRGRRSRRVDQPGRDDVGAELARASPRARAGSPRAARAAPRTAASTRRGRCRTRRRAASSLGSPAAVPRLAAVAPRAAQPRPRAPVEIAGASARSRSRSGGRRRRCSGPGPRSCSSVIAVCRQPRIATASTTPMIVPRPPKIEMPPSSTIVTT